MSQTKSVGTQMGVLVKYTKISNVCITSTTMDRYLPHLNALSRQGQIAGFSSLLSQQLRTPSQIFDESVTLEAKWQVSFTEFDTEC